jgi:phosphoglycolate phosphatase
VILAVIVDVDDTLCLTEAASFELENEVLALLGRPPMSRGVHLRTWGEPLLDAMPHRSPGLDLGRFAELFPVTHRRYLAGGRLDVIPPENLRALDQLVSDGRTVLLLTSRAEAEVRHLLEPDHVLAGRITGAYHQGNTRFRKPDPRVFDELLAETGHRPERAIETDSVAVPAPFCHARRLSPSAVRAPTPNLDEGRPRDDRHSSRFAP